MAFLTKEDREKLIAEVMDPSKVVLTCGIHNWSYGSKRPPMFKCPRCNMVSFLGLLANTPPNRRDEVLEMLEYSVHQLVQADKEGRIDRIKLMGKPEVTIQKDVDVSSDS
jgi:hypothetical protein